MHVGNDFHVRFFSNILSYIIKKKDKCLHDNIINIVQMHVYACVLRPDTDFALLAYCSKVWYNY